MPSLNVKSLDIYPHFKKFTDILGEQNIRLVGGCVRDLTSSTQPKDYDFATSLSPKNAKHLLEKNGIKCIPTGIKYGTLTALLDDKTYEITSLRRDIKTYGRDAEVAFTDSWHEDAKRRDFTINAMYVDINGKIYDFFDGTHDLQTKTVKFIGNPSARITEDYLRILRYFRFISYLGNNNIDSASFSACKNHAANILSLSGERIHNELIKIFSGKYVFETIEMMEKAGVLKVLGFKKQQPVSKNINETPDFFVKFSVFLLSYPPTNLSIHEILRLYKFSNKEIDCLNLLVEQDYSKNTDIKKTINNLLFYQSKQKAAQFLQIYGLINSTNTNIYKKTLITPPKKPFCSDDFIKMGYNGKSLGAKIKQAEQLWIASGFTISKDELLKVIKNAD